MSLAEFREVSRVFHPRGGGAVPGRRPAIVAVDRLSLALAAGEALGLVGESGSGKTVSGEMLVRLQQPTGGSILFEGHDIGRLAGAELKAFRRQVQIIFQDPFASLNPRFTVAQSVTEPLFIHQLPGDHRQLAQEALDLVELRPARRYLERYPHQLSGGERQRVAIARALVLRPRLLVADEPTSMLDASVRAGILNLFRSLRDQLNLTMLFISHDLATIRYLCDRVAVMYRGRLVEVGQTEAVIHRPRHPYTQALLRAVPRLRPESRAGNGPGEEELGAAPPGGCRFLPRCPLRLPACAALDPDLRPDLGDHWVACHAIHAPVPGASGADAVATSGAASADGDPLGLGGESAPGGVRSPAPN